MPQPVSYNPGTPVSGSIQENNISYVVDGQNRNYRGGFGGLSWMSEVPAENNVIFIGNSTSLGRGPAGKPLFYPSYNNSSANIVYAVNTLPGSPRNFTTTGSAYNWAVTNNFFINNSNNPIPRIDADGLVLYVDANQPSSYPQIGTSVYDFSGRNNNGTLFNNTGWNNNGWFTFDGTDDYINCGNNSSLAIVGDITIYALVYFNSFSGYNGIVGKTSANSVPAPFDYYTTPNNPTSLSFLRGNGSSFTTVTSNQNISLNRWHQIAVTMNGTNVTHYLNGTSNGTGILSTTVGDNGDPVLIGNRGDFFTDMNGNISSVQIYSRALTTAEIKQNYFQSNIVQDGLVFMVDANNLVSYPKSGTSWYNLTGSVASGSLINGPTFSPSNGGTIVFDGVDDYIRTTYNSAYDFSNANFSIEAWFYSNPTSNGNYTSICNRATYGSNERSFELFIANDTGTPYIWFGVFNSNWTYVNNPSLTGIQFNEWNHVIATSDGVGNGKVYINGILRQTNSSFNTAVTVTTVPFLIGAYVGGAVGGFFNGKIPAVKLYNKALTSTEVQQNYQATKDKFQGQQIVTNGLVLNLDAANKDSYPGTGTTWTDLSGTGNNATLYNGTNWNSTGYMSTDAVDDYIQIPNAASLQLTTGFTQVIWVKLNNIVTVSYKTLFGKPNYTKYGIIVEWYGGNPILFDFSVSGNRNIIGTLSPGSLGTWIMVAQSYNASGGSNNQIANIRGGTTATSTATRTGNVDTDTSPMNIGQAGLSMDVGMALLYNRGLTQTELDQIYNATKGRFGY